MAETLPWETPSTGRVAYFDCSLELLSEFFVSHPTDCGKVISSLPADTKVWQIRGRAGWPPAYMDNCPQPGFVRIYVESSEFPEIDEAEMIPQVSPTFTFERGDCI